MDSILLAGSQVWFAYATRKRHIPCLAYSQRENIAAGLTQFFRLNVITLTGIFLLVVNKAQKLKTFSKSEKRQNFITLFAIVKRLNYSQFGVHDDCVVDISCKNLLEQSSYFLFRWEISTRIVQCDYVHRGLLLISPSNYSHMILLTDLKY